MSKITRENLYTMARNLSALIDAPQGAIWTKDENGKLVATVGRLIIEPGSRTYGRTWKLVQITNSGGGQRTLLSALTARDLGQLMFAYAEGYSEGQKHPRV